MTNPFLKEAWERKAGEEKGESKSERHWAINLEDLENRIKTVKNKENQQQLQEFLDDLKQKCYKYCVTCQNLEEISKKFREQTETVRDEERKGLIQEVESADKRRRAIHKCIEDDLNILSRLFSKHNLDNSWRASLMDKEVIGSWALDMAETE